jgi:hypothetical protein
MRGLSISGLIWRTTALSYMYLFQHAYGWVKYHYEVHCHVLREFKLHFFMNKLHRKRTTNDTSLEQYWSVMRWEEKWCTLTRWCKLSRYGVLHCCILAFQNITFWRKRMEFSVATTNWRTGAHWSWPLWLQINFSHQEKHCTVSPEKLVLLRESINVILSYLLHSPLSSKLWLET